MKKICLITEHFYPYPGGISEHVHQLALHLSKYGFRVKIICPHYPSFLNLVPFSSKGLPYEIVRVSPALPFPVNGSISVFSINFFSALNLLLEHLKHCDIVHIHGTLAPTLPLLALVVLEKINPKPVIVFTFHPTHEKSIFYEIFHVKLQKLLDIIDGVIAVSPSALESIERQFEIKGRKVIIPNGVKIGRRKRIKKEVKNLLFVGRLEPRKGLDLVFKALKLVEERLNFIVVGEGFLKPYYKFIASKEKYHRIIFKGHLSRAELFEQYQEADIIVVPAKKGESFGMVIAEAMANDVLVIASDIKGFRYSTGEGKYALLFKNNDFLSLAEKLNRAINDFEMRKDLIERARIFAQKNFSWEKIVRETIKFYNNLTSPEPFTISPITIPSVSDRI